MLSESDARDRLEQNNQEHILRFWDKLDQSQRDMLLAQIDTIDFKLMNRLIERWIENEPPEERFEEIKPVPVIPKGGGEDAREAWEAGETA